MQLIKEKLKQIYLPINTGTLALFFSLLAVGYVASATNSPCLQAQSTCAVGGESEFSGNVGIKGGTTYVATLDASGITADRNIELPDADGELMIGGGLGASKVVATDVAGDLTTTNVYPLSIGISGQVLTVDATNTFLEYSTITGVPSLTGSEVVKTDPSGDLTTGTVDVDQLTPGGASTNDEIRMGAGGDWEAYTPSSGGDIRKVANGNMVVNSTDAMMVIACWHGQITLDPDKEYSLYIDGSPINRGQAGAYTNWFRPQTGDCTSGGGSGFVTSGIKTAWDVVGNSANTQSFSTAENYCFGIAGGAYNTSGTRVSNIAGVLNLRPWRNEGYGFNMDWKLSATAYNSVNNATQVQFGTGTCLDVTTADFDTITGIDFFLEGNGNTSRKWALYEIDY